MPVLSSLNISQTLTTICNAPRGYDALLLGELATKENNIIHIATEEGRALSLKKQLHFFHPTLEILWFPPWDCLPYDRVSPHTDVLATRIDTLTQLLKTPTTQKPRLILTTVSAFLQRVPPRSKLEGTSRTYSKGEEIQYDDLISFLGTNNYARREVVRDWGEFAIRGGLLDIFPPGASLCGWTSLAQCLRPYALLTLSARSQRVMLLSWFSNQ